MNNAGQPVSIASSLDPEIQAGASINVRWALCVGRDMSGIVFTRSRMIASLFGATASYFSAAAMFVRVMCNPHFPTSLFKDAQGALLNNRAACLSLSNYSMSAAVCAPLTYKAVKG